MLYSALGILLCSQYLISRCTATDDIEGRETGNDTVPAPIVVPPSQYFEGNDGPWSTFNLRVGTPEQDVRVLISTASSETLVVMSQYGCSATSFETVPADCASSRGMMYDNSTSTTYKNQGFYGINGNRAGADGVGLEANLGYYQATQVGLDTLGLGLIAGGNGPSLENQTVAGIPTAYPFYLGIFGLSPQPFNLTTLGNSTGPSFFQSLKNQNLIPSLSWSYTAGAIYRLKQVYGQLVFGGYDQSRFINNGVSFDLAGDTTRDIVVALQSITYSGSTQSSLLTSPILTFIDSTDPNIWLPASACQAFEATFGLTLDKASGLYLINSTQHTNLLASDALVTFRLSNSLNGGQTVSIALPYSAFDLTASVPLLANGSSSYFPLRQAANSTQYTLGRTFLQEAYLTVDYGRGNFSVSQCAWVAGAEPSIVAIDSKDDRAPSSSSSTPSSSSSPAAHPLSTGTVVAIIVVVVVLLISLCAGAFFLLLRRRGAQLQRQRLDEDQMNNNYNAHALEVLRQTHGELSNDSQLYQLHSEQKAFEGHEMEVPSKHGGPLEAGNGMAKDGLHLGVYEMPGSPALSAELDAEETAKGPWAKEGAWREDETASRRG